MFTENIENIKLASLKQELNLLKQDLKRKGISVANSKDYKRIHKAISRLKAKINPVEKVDNSIKENLTKNINSFEEIKINKKKQLKFSNLDFIAQWELAPVLTGENMNVFIPSQIEDLHAFILQNYSLSPDDTREVPVQILAVQFLMYLIERENSNVRISNLSEQLNVADSQQNKKAIKNLKKQIINSLTDMNGWKDIHHIVSKNFDFNNNLRNIHSDASIGDTYFAPISNFTNTLSLDGLGNFLELFKARAEWISKSSCCKLKVKTLQVNNIQGAVDQITVVSNLRLKENSWLKNHSYLLNWSLPFEPSKNFIGAVME